MRSPYGERRIRRITHIRPKEPRPDFEGVLTLWGRTQSSGTTAVAAAPPATMVCEFHKPVNRMLGRLLPAAGGSATVVSYSFYFRTEGATTHQPSGNALGNAITQQMFER